MPSGGTIAPPGRCDDVGFGVLSALRGFLPAKARQWLGPLVTCAGAAALAVLLIIAAGLPNLAASIPHPLGWAAFLHTTFRRSVAHHSAGLTAPADLNAGWRIAQGAAHYGHVCATCHGAPGLGQDPVALSMRPRPQYLPQVVGQFAPNELFWIVKHGVKYSAMPAWPAQQRDDEIWSVVAFLKRLPRLDYRAYRKLAFGADAGETSPHIAFARPGRSHGYDLHADTPPDEYAYRAPTRALSDFAETGDVPGLCARCHGADGRGGPRGGAPNIAMQEPIYLFDALKAFAAGRRHSGFMQPVAAGLSAHQVEALARYYAAKPDRPVAQPRPPERLIARGRAIAERGLPRRELAACESCHGRLPEAYGKVIPRLRGQYRWYLDAQMRAFRDGGRGDTAGYDPMPATTHKLNDADIRAIAAFYAAAQPATAGAQAPTAAGR